MINKDGSNNVCTLFRQSNQYFVISKKTSVARLWLASPEFVMDFKF